MAGLRTASTEEVARLLEYARWKNRPFLKMDCEAELTRRQVQGRTEEDRRVSILTGPGGPVLRSTDQ